MSIKYRVRHLIKVRNDVVACFDRMIIIPISLYSRAYEILDRVCKLYATNLQTMNYKLQTAMDISTDHYHHTV